MSLINDALRRASQSERNRPRRNETATGMEPALAARDSSLPMILAAVALIALLLAGWFFWQWWKARPAGVVSVPVSHPTAVAPVPARPAPVVAATPPPKPAPAPVPVAQPAPVPVTKAAAPAAVSPSNAVAAAPVAPAPHPVVDNANAAWPVQLKLSAIFYSLNHPRVILNGSVYGIGDEVQGVVINKIEKNKVQLTWNGHSKELMMDGQ